MSDIKKFLDKYDIILFDMDGVVTSEQEYWNAAAMTSYEMLVSSKYFGDKSIDASEIYEYRTQIRRNLFCDDKTTEVLKNKGVNSNWDLAYVVLSEALLDEEHSFENVYRRVCEYGDSIFSEYESIAKKLSSKFNKPLQYFERGGEMWCEIRDVFQRKYHGEENIPGLINDEKPLFGIGRTSAVLRALKQAGKTLGIGTGRPMCEIEGPLKNWDLYKYFDVDRIVSYDDVVEAERELSAYGEKILLTKPHPFMFLKGAFTKSCPTQKIIHGEYDKDVLKRTLVVGDAGADILAAQAAGMSFLAVLTGISAASAREYFEKQGTDYILDSICDMIEK